MQISWFLACVSLGFKSKSLATGIRQTVIHYKNNAQLKCIPTVGDIENRFELYAQIFYSVIDDTRYHLIISHMTILLPQNYRRQEITIQNEYWPVAV